MDKNIRVSSEEPAIDARNLTELRQFKREQAQKADYRNKHFVDLMLASLPKQFMNDAIIKTFNRLRPLTIVRFAQVAEAYELPEPNFNLVGTHLRRKKDQFGNFHIGQISAETGE